MSVFKKAERKQVKLKAAITGPSGSGKTLSALRMAAGLGKKIAVIDSENGSASLYAEKVQFDTLELSPPYTIAKYVEAIQAAVAAKYDVVIIDSITHAWSGEGGLLAKKESLDQRGGSSYTNWAGITKEHEAFKAAILNSPIHLIATMRSKQDYIVETNDRGKSAPRKVGLAPIQREGMEYEFTVVFDVAADHTAACSKDRTGLFDGHLSVITEATGEKLATWLAQGVEAKEPIAEAPVNTSQVVRPNVVPTARVEEVMVKPTVDQIRDLFSKIKEAGWDERYFKKQILDNFNVQSARDLTIEQYNSLTVAVNEKMPDQEWDVGGTVNALSEVSQIALRAQERQISGKKSPVTPLESPISRSG